MAVTLWLTDRTRYTTGTGRCAMERYLKNHAGPTGYGLVHKSESLPLMTGTYFHTALEDLWIDMQTFDRLPPREVVRHAILKANAQYEQKVNQRGFRGLLASESTDRIIKEQQTLIAGMVWAAMRNVLPWIHTHYRVLQAELESVYVLDCTCGLGSHVLEVAAHEAKGCEGIGQMLRQDCIAERRIGNTLAYFESKSTGWGGDNWAPQWETKPQLSIGSFGLKERYNQEITELFILAGYKGSRKTDEGDGFEPAITRQESPLCYGYCRPGNPPLSTDDWMASYRWEDADGKKHQVTRAHKKRGVWELPESDWPVWENRPADDRSVMEFWIDQLPQPVLDKIVYLIGPLNRQDAQIAALKQNIVGEEREWQRIVWELYEIQQQGHGWASDVFQAALHRLVPASWECRRFGVKHECEFTKLCFKKDGWQDPIGLGGYRNRRPHHSTELEQAIERGLLPEQAEEDEETEE